MRHETGNILKYHDMEMSEVARTLLITDHARFASYCNGVGSRVGFWNNLLWHVTPNTIWFLDITPASDVHDVECTVPSVFTNMRMARKAFDDANMRFHRNMKKLIYAKGGFLEPLRLVRAGSYYHAVCSEAAFKSFMHGKQIIDKGC